MDTIVDCDPDGDFERLHADRRGALAGWPQAILVTSSPVAGPPSREDAVIAVDWDRWVPGEVVEGILEGVG